MMGKGSVNHNTRAFSAKNVDKERSRDNVEFCHSDIKEVYHNLFDEALERYNAKQKRSDRKIDDYYEKIRRGKQEKLFYEVIFQIGNKDDMNVQSNEGQLAKEILCEFMEQFQKRNPNLYVFSISTCSLPTSIWTKQRRICTLILFHLQQAASVDLIREFPSKEH
jgi:hypothetical protein